MLQSTLYYYEMEQKSWFCGWSQFDVVISSILNEFVVSQNWISDSDVTGTSIKN